MSVVENSLADIFYAPCPTSALSPCGSASSFPVPVSQPLPTASAALLLASSRASPPLLQLLFALVIGCNFICTSLGFLHFCSVPPRSLCATSGPRPQNKFLLLLLSHYTNPCSFLYSSTSNSSTRLWKGHVIVSLPETLHWFAPRVFLPWSKMLFESKFWNASLFPWLSCSSLLH